MAGVCLVATTTQLPDVMRVLAATVRAADFVAWAWPRCGCPVRRRHRAPGIRSLVP
jgi:hypothetical protein